MGNAVSLKEWSDGVTPEKNDFLSWSNLLFQRSLQTSDPELDPVSEYFFGQWKASAKDRVLVANVFERIFSGYSLNFQVRVLSALEIEGVIKPIDLLDKVKSNGPLYRHLLVQPDVWTEMKPHQLADRLHVWFPEIVRFGKEYSNEMHPAWKAIAMFKTTTARLSIFNTSLGETMLDTFSLFRDEHAHFDIATFHETVNTFSKCWDVAPAQIVYGLMLVDYNKNRGDYDRYKQFLEPYATDIRELIQFLPDPRSRRMHENLPDSTRPLAMDMVFAFALALDPTNVFMDRHQIPQDVPDMEVTQSLISSF